MTAELPPGVAEAIREELVCLWGDLDEARRAAFNGTWSIRCANLADRIHALTRIVGPVPWGETSFDLVLAGVYEGVHAEIGVRVEVPMDEVRSQHERYQADLRRSLSIPPPPASRRRLPEPAPTRVRRKSGRELQSEIARAEAKAAEQAERLNRLRQQLAERGQDD